MSEYIVKLPISGAADEFFKTHEMPDMTLYGYPLTGEIVRCRDCIYYVEDSDPIDPGWPMMCKRTGDDMVEPYGFCAWGARRDA